LGHLPPNDILLHTAEPLLYQWTRYEIIHRDYKIFSSLILQFGNPFTHSPHRLTGIPPIDYGKHLISVIKLYGVKNGSYLVISYNTLAREANSSRFNVSPRRVPSISARFRISSSNCLS